MSIEKRDKLRLNEGCLFCKPMSAGGLPGGRIASFLGLVGGEKQVTVAAGALGLLLWNPAVNAALKAPAPFHYELFYSVLGLLQLNNSYGSPKYSKT